MFKRASNVLLKVSQTTARSTLRQNKFNLPASFNLTSTQTSVAFSTFSRFNQRVVSLNSFPRRSFASLPSHQKLGMPALSPSMETGKVVKWNVKVGDKVEAGTSICDVETDKATLAFEVQDEGYIAAILVEEGATAIALGKTVAIIVDNEADIKAFANYSEGETSSSKSEKPKEEKSEEKTEKKPKEEKSEGKSAQKTEQKSEKKEEKTIKKKAVIKKSAPKDLPAHTKVDMPALSPTMETGKILQWTKKVGDKIDAGDTIANVETDKATIDFVYQDDGYLAKTLVEEGQDAVTVGQLVAIVVDNKEDVKAFADYTAEESSGKAEESTQGEEEVETEAEESESKPEKSDKSEQQSSKTQRSSGDRVVASPLAKRTASEKNVDLSSVEGSGPNGRVLKHNVDEASQKGGEKAQTKTQPKAQEKTQEKAPEKEKPAGKEAAGAKAQAPKVQQGENPYEDLPLTSIREIIAKRLLQSKTTVPHFYLETEIRMDEAIKIRNVLNESAKTKISFNDLFIKAAALACIEVPEVNSQWHGTHIRRYQNCDVSVAVDTGSGLITPIVFSANQKGLNAISLNTKELVEKAKKNALKPNEFQGGTFSISNLGMLGIDNFAAVINPPQSCILAVGKTDKKVVADGDSFKAVSVMNVTLSCDHRVVDGAVGAKWLDKFKSYLEKPHTMLL